MVDFSAAAVRFGQLHVEALAWAETCRRLGMSDAWGRMVAAWVAQTERVKFVAQLASQHGPVVLSVQVNMVLAAAAGVVCEQLLIAACAEAGIPHSNVGLEGAVALLQLVCSVVTPEALEAAKTP